MLNKCPFCGNEIEEGNKFCGSCGHSLTDIGQAEVPAEPVEAPVEAPAAPTETPIEVPIEPAQAPAAPAQPQVTPQPPQNLAYTAPQQPVPGYNAPQQNMPGYGTMTQTAVKKNKKGMIMAIIIGVVMVLGIIAAVMVFSNRGSEHGLDGEYKLTGLAVGDQDYSSYIGYLETDYLLKVDGSDITIEAQGYKTTAKIDQKNHTISSDDFGTVEFTVDGNDITLNLNSEYTMTFTRQ